MSKPLQHVMCQHYSEFCVSGMNCETDINECETYMSLCYNDAVCVNLPGTYSCRCSVGYLGEHCDVANCSLGQCVNNGTCHIDDGKWSCDCPEFYTGIIFCDIFTIVVLVLLSLVVIICYFPIKSAVIEFHIQTD